MWCRRETGCRSLQIAAARRVTPLDLVREELVDDRGERGRHGERQRRARRIGADGLFELAAIAIERGIRPVPGEHLVEDDAERPEVDVLVDVAVFEPLG